MTGEKIDKLDIGIIRELQSDARKSYREIAEKFGVVEATVYNRVNKLLGLGVIKKFIPDIDFQKLGFDLITIVGIVAEGEHLQEVERKVAKDPNVSAVYDVTGEYDAIAVAKFRNRVELDGFVKRLLSMPYVKKTYTMVTLNVVKEEHGVKV